MADAVVGNLRAVLSLDSAKFDAGAKKASASAATLGRNLERLTPQAERMVKAFSGDKVLQQANNLAAAVQKVGGVSRLTATEQARVNTTVTQAIEKYRALGQQAPAALMALQRETAKSTAVTSGLTAALAKVGPALIAAFSIGSITRFARSVGAFAGRMTDLAAETGIGVERLQAFNFVGAGAGLTVEDITSSVTQLSRRLAGDDKSAVAAVTRLGLKLHELMQMGPDQAFVAIGEAIARVEDPMERSRLAIELFGRSGSRMLRIFNEDLGNTIDQVEKSGAVIDKELIEKADRFADAWDRAFLQMQAGAVNAAGLISRAFSLGTPGRPGTFADAKVGGGGPTPAEAAARLKAEVDAQLKRMQGALKAPGIFQVPSAVTGATQEEIATLERRTEALLASIKATQEYQAAVAKLVEQISGAGAITAVRQLESAFTQLSPAQRTNERIVADVLQRYESLRSVVGTKVAPTLEALFIQFGTLNARAWDFSLAMRATVPSVEAAAESVNADLIPALHGLQAAFDATARAKANLDELMRLGMIAPDGIRSENVSHGILEDFLPSQRWLDIVRNVGMVNAQIGDSFASLLVGLGRKTTEWVDGVLVETGRMKNAMLDIWHSIRMGIANVLSGMLQDFISGYVRRVIATTAGMAVAGGGAGAAIGGGAASVAGGVGAGAAGGGGAGAGFLANPAFWTNPYTIAGVAGAALLTWAITKKGLFRGGEEGTQVNPKRDQFIAQFGGHHMLAALLTRKGAGEGGGSLMQRLNAADSLTDFRGVESSIAKFLAPMRVKQFNFGGFVPPNVTLPAMLHGGAFGEDIVPRTGPQASTANVNVQLTINAVDARGVRDLVRSRDFLDSIAHVFEFNTGFVTTRVKSSLR